MVLADTEVGVYRVLIQGREAPIDCRGDEKVTSALERAGSKRVHVGCRQGGCGACRVRVLSGDYETGKMSRAHITKEEEDDGFVLSCRLYPRSDLVLEPAYRGRWHRVHNN